MAVVRPRHPRIRSRSIWGLLGGLSVAAVALAGCGDDGDGDKPAGPDAVDVDSGLPGDPAWYEVKYPTGGTIWCLYGYTDGTYAGGPYVWCDRGSVG